MALVEGSKHALEITVPVEEVEKETDRVVESLKQKVHLPGFRPGKIPASMIRSRFSADIRKQVLEALVPKHLRELIEKDNLVQIKLWPLDAEVFQTKVLDKPPTPVIKMSSPAFSTVFHGRPPS